ncbi:TPA: hypothetical protein ACX6MH_001469 [Photobacterium damselae]
MFKYILFFCFISNKIFANEIPLIFPMKAHIEASELDYKITNINLKPDTLDLDYDQKRNIFKSSTVKLNIETNISDVESIYNYVLTIAHESSTCTLWDATERTYEPPIVSIMIDSKKFALSDKPSPSCTFNSTIVVDGVKYLSDRRDVILDFKELPSEIDNYLIETCQGAFTLIASLDL